MKVYDLIETYLTKHVYIRGDYIGAAPADPYRRRDTNKRIVKQNGDLGLRVYATTVARLSPDDTLTINLNSWHTQTTFKALNSFFRRFRIPLYVGSITHRGVSQTALYNTCPPSSIAWAFYDGMKLQLHPHDPPINLEPKPFKYRAIDRAASAEFRRNSKEFFQALPLLHAALPQTSDPSIRFSYPGTGARLREVIANPACWPDVVGWHAYSGYRRHPRLLETVIAKIKKDAKCDLYWHHDTPYTHL